MLAARARLLALIVGIPALGFAASIGIRSHFDSNLRTDMARETIADPAALATMTYASFCRTNDVGDPCDTDRHLAWLGDASRAAGLFGLALLVIIAAAGYAARSNRALLVTLFRPGLSVTAWATTGLILVHAGIAIAVVCYGESAFMGGVHLGIIGGIGFGAVAGVAVVAKSAFGLVKKAETFAVGLPVSAEQAGGLWSHTNAIADALGSLKPDHIVLGLDPSFFVTEANVTTLNGRLTGKTLFCSLPLARILTVDELRAIIGHELGHFRGEDTQYSERFYPIYRGTTTALVSLRQVGGRGWGALALMPAVAIFGFLLERFSVAVSHQSRSRELLADAAGAEAASARTMATALVKLHAFSGVWGNFQRSSIDLLRQGRFYANASQIFASGVAGTAGPQSLEGIAETHTSHPTDSHPPLAARLANLGVSLESVAAESLLVRPAAPAAALVPDYETHERTLSGAYQGLLAQRLGLAPATKATAIVSRPRTGVPGPGQVGMCPACQTRVLAKMDGSCPRCGAMMSAAV